MERPYQVVVWGATGMRIIFLTAQDFLGRPSLYIKHNCVSV